MERLLLLVCILGLSSCGEPRVVEGPPGPAGTNGASCSVERLESGSLITCSDGSEAYVEDGLDGEKGEPGAQGNCDTEAPTTTYECHVVDGWVVVRTNKKKTLGLPLQITCEPSND